MKRQSTGAIGPALLSAVLMLQSGGQAPAKSAPVNLEGIYERLNDAMRLREAGRVDQAVRVLKSIEAIPESVPLWHPFLSDSERHPERLRGIKSHAQQQLGEVRFAREDYKGALEIFRSKILSPDDCANGQWARDARNALWQGACLEAMGQTLEALEFYLPYSLMGRFGDDPWIARRIERIYAANGASAELIRFDDAVDDLSPDTYSRERFRPSYALRAWSRLRELEERRDWAGLVAFMDRSAETEQRWLALAISRTLRSHPRESVPFLIENWRRAPQIEWRVYTLGYIATPEALQFLEGLFSIEDATGSRFAAAIVNATSLAGDEGARFLGSLESSAEGNLKLELSRWRDDRAAGRPFRPDRWWPTEPAMTEPKCDRSLPTAEMLLVLATSRE